MMKQNLLIGANGIKTISLGDLDTWLDAQINQRITNTGDLAKYYGQVPWLFRGIRLISQAVGSMPFDIYPVKGDEPIDSTEDYQNVVGFFPRPRLLLGRIAASQFLTGKAYVGNLRNRIMTKELRYYAPTTIKPLWNKEAGELIGFERSVNGKRIELTKEQVIYLWLSQDDPFIETGEPQNYPAKAAMLASGVLFNLDQFVEAFFARGAIKTTMVALAGNPPAAERKRFQDTLEAGWQGIKNAFKMPVVSADSITAVPIGEGVKDLQNTELSQNKREDIAAALGIPYTKLFSGSAAGLGGGGVKDSDDVAFYTDTVIPTCYNLQEELNEQLFVPNGYRLKFAPETLDVMQEDEVARTAAMSSFIDILNKCATLEEFQAAVNIYGMELDEEAEALIQTAFQAKETRRQEAQAQMQPQADQQAQPDQSNFPVSKPEPKQLAAGDNKTIERKQFLKWASKRTPGDYDKFNFEHLDANEQTAIKAEAGGAANGDKSAEFFRRRDEIRASRNAPVLHPPA